MRNTCSALLSTALLGCALALAPAAGLAAEPCMDMAMAMPVPVPGDPGAYTVKTAAGERVIRSPKYSATIVPDIVVNVTNWAYSVDTVKITAGQTVQWHLISGLHTVTSGTGSLDIDAGAIFDVALSTTLRDFYWTFPDAGVYPYFCIYHDVTFNMKGVVQVTAVAGVGPSPVAKRTGFSRPPQPNPSRDAVTFSIALPHDGDVMLDVLDAAGRRVASLQHGALAAGEHPFRWNGRAEDGRMAAPGVYRVHLRAPDADETRTISLLR